jgi:ketosteroid isomerase-like protein
MSTFRTLLASVTLFTAACTTESSSTDPVVEAHVEVIRDRIVANNTRDWATWQTLHTPDAVRTAPELSEPLAGAAAMRAGIEELVVSFPDYHLELIEAFGVDDRLMARITASGTMLGALDIDGTVVPPTGLHFEQDWIAVLTFDGDQISAIDEFHDNYGLLIQLGLAQ